MAPPSEDNPIRIRYFFDKGLRFACLQCGGCCGGDPGTIFISGKEITVLADHLKVSQSQLIRKYLYPFKDSYSIREDDQGRCLFFDNGCTIHPVRPHQCRTFPFWFDNLRSESRWRNITQQCPGIGQGRQYTREEILSIVQTTMEF
jgi:uncharacterized protein